MEYNLLCLIYCTFMNPNLQPSEYKYQKLTKQDIYVLEDEDDFI